MHYSGLIDDYGSLQKFFETISEYLPVGLIFLGIGEHVVPWLVKNVEVNHIAIAIYLLIIIVVSTFLVAWAFAFGKEYYEDRFKTNN